MASDRRTTQAAAASPGFGQRLRAARQQRGITLQDISQSTKIPVTMLEALENDNTSRLPGGIFSRSFVRSFATAVGLDPEDALADFLRAFPEDGASEDRRAEEAAPTADGRLWPLLLLVAGVILVVGAAVAWYRGYGPDVRSVWQRIQGPPQATLGGDVQQAPPVEARARPQAAPPPEAASPAASSAPAQTDAASEPTAATATGAQAVSPTPAPPTSVPTTVASAAPPGDGRVRLSIRPSGPCWVKVTAVGSVRLSRLVAAGEKVDFAAASRFQLEVGDAGAFAYVLDGRPGRPLGSPGRVARVTIDAANSADFVAR
jgi:cytoskeleton protein RodZ